VPESAVAAPALLAHSIFVWRGRPAQPERGSVSRSTVKSQAVTVILDEFHFAKLLRVADPSSSRGAITPASQNPNEIKSVKTWWF
jgi:hypothetical protein